MSKKKIGLVLSGGGYKSAAHIGAYKAMQELGIEADLVAGTSAGAVVGAFIAAGHGWEVMMDFLEKTELISYRNYTFHKAGLFDSAKYRHLFDQYFPENSFESLKIPLFVAATDLIEGKTHYFYRGELIKPLIASCAVPGVFSPVPIEDMLLCDGGITNNFPIEPLLVMSDEIIGVYVNHLNSATCGSFKSSVSVLQRAYMIIRKTQFEQKLSSCDVLITPPNTVPLNFMSRNNLEEIFEMGYRTAIEKLSEWKMKR